MHLGDFSDRYWRHKNRMGISETLSQPAKLPIKGVRMVRKLPPKKINNQLQNFREPIIPSIIRATVQPRTVPIIPQIIT